MSYKRILTEAHKRKISEGVKRAWAKIPSAQSDKASNNEFNDILSDGEKNNK